MVSAGASGIGLALAERFLAKGIKVAINAALTAHSDANGRAGRESRPADSARWVKNGAAVAP